MMSEDPKTAANRFEIVFKELGKPAAFVNREELAWVTTASSKSFINNDLR